MKIKDKKIYKNGAVAAYVYYKDEKKWKWRFIKGASKKKNIKNNIKKVKKNNIKEAKKNNKK